MTFSLKFLTCFMFFCIEIAKTKKTRLSRFYIGGGIEGSRTPILSNYSINILIKVPFVSCKIS